MKEMINFWLLNTGGKTFVFREKSDSEKVYKNFEFDEPPKRVSVSRFSRKGEKLLNMVEDTAVELAKMGIF